MKLVKIVLGAIVGVLIGTIAGLVAIAWWQIARSPSPPPGYAVGWDPISLLHDPALLSLVLFCALAFACLFAYLFTRIGRRQHSHL